MVQWCLKSFEGLGDVIANRKRRLSVNAEVLPLDGDRVPVIKLILLIVAQLNTCGFT